MARHCAAALVSEIMTEDKQPTVHFM